MENNLQKKFGLACSLEYCVIIIVYNWSSSLSSSKEIEKKDTPGQNPFDINIRTISFSSYHEIGKGHSGLESFCGIMHEHAPSSECKSI